MFFTNGVLGYTGDTLPFPKRCGDRRSQIDSNSLSPRRKGPYSHVQSQDWDPTTGISPAGPSAPEGENGLVFSAVRTEEATPKLRAHK